MFKIIIKSSFLIIAFVFVVNFQSAESSSFSTNLKEVRAEINRDDLNAAIEKIKKILISNENEQEQINVLFGDIYLKINQPQKAEDFYQKSFFTSNKNVESLVLMGLAEVRLLQGKLSDAINYAEQTIRINQNIVRPKIILAIAKTRLGEGEEAIKILNDLYDSKKTAEIALAISDYFNAFDDNKRSIEVLEEFISRDPSNIKVINQLANLYMFEGNKEKALEYKFKAYKYYEFNRNKKKLRETKNWILSVDPKYFDKPAKVTKNQNEENKEYEEEEINNYQDNQVVPNYEKFEFASNKRGSGFIVGKGRYVITNYHVIHNAQRIAVRNGLGQIRNAKVVNFSKKLDLALLQLDKTYDHRISLKTKTFKSPRPGDDVVTIGFPGIGETAWQPTITQGIVSKVFTEDDKYPATFMTTIAINAGNSGGPIFDLNGNLVGVAYASLNKLDWIKAGLSKEVSLPTDMGYAIKSQKINKIFEYKQNNKFKNKKYSRSELYQKMLPSVVIVAILKK